MQPNNITDLQAQMAYRTEYLTEQFQRSGSSAHRGHRGQGERRRKRLHLRWSAPRTSAQ